MQSVEVSPMLMTAFGEKALKILEGKEYSGMKPGLKRIKSFIKTIGNPEKSFRAVHIAGTNGKGSTAKLLAGILTANGVKTGLFTSPHIRDFTERISIDGRNISRKRLFSYLKRFAVLPGFSELTYFEILTAAAFAYFKDGKVDIAVIETGLGGRFDATNIIAEPLLCVITNVGLDHQAYLGKTIASIAFEKAGIIKKGVPVITGRMPQKALEVVRARANKKKAPVLLFGKDFNFSKARADWEQKGESFFYEGLFIRSELFVSLLGEYQRINCSLALAAFECIVKSGNSGYSLQKTKRALKSAYWPARFEIIKQGGKTLIIDGAHNPSGAAAFVKAYFSSPWKNDKAAVLFAVMKDKEYKPIIKSFSEIAGRTAIIRSDSPRVLGAGRAACEWRKHIKPDRVEVFDSAKEALRSFKKNKVIVVSGSLSLAGRVL